MVCAFNRCAQIFTGFGVLLFVIGIVGITVVRGLNQPRFTIDVLGGSTSFIYSFSDTNHDGYVDLPSEEERGEGVTLYIASSDECDLSAPTVEVVLVENNEPAIYSRQCEEIYNQVSSELWQASHDPPLRSIGFFKGVEAPNQTHPCPDFMGEPSCAKVAGAYRVTCSVRCWIVDDDLNNVSNGGLDDVHAALYMVALIMVALVGAILMVVACCCCCQGPDKGAFEAVSSDTETGSD